MSVSHVPHWQKILDSLTKKAEEWNFLNGLSRKSELELAQKFLGHDILRSFLNEWLELCLKNSAKKSATRSVEFRRKGNVEFQRHHDSTSLLHYTDAIRFAPYESEEHALALANRSAVLFHMKEFKECISDAEMALSLPYPARLRYKLLVRQAQSFFQLQQWNECESTLLLASKSLFDESGCFEGAKKEILALQDELNKIKKNVVNKPEETPELSPPLLFEGLSLKLPHASAALEPRYTEKKGRHIVTNQIVTSGDVLFVEKPYSFVVLPDQTKTHCHHCCKTLLAPVPCRKCVDVLFCTVSCELASYAKYHQWECGGIALMSAVGVAHLGLRIVLCTGRPSKVLERAHAASNNIETSVGVHEDPYLAVYSLLPHLQDMTPEDIFQYTATAELLTLFLFHKTDYFKYGRVLSDDVNEKSDVVMGICSLLIRHVAQLVCNAHAIVKFDFEECSSNSSPHSGKVKTMIEKRIATAIYSSASMMNHSCDPNISSSFHNEVLVVKARHDIPKGGEVFNCYGPHFSRMQTAERRAALQAQYFFFCECSACVSDQEEPFDPIQERLWALRCNACGGPLLHNVHGREPAGSKSTRCESQSAHFMICDSCGSHQPISSQVCDAFSAQSFYKKGCEEMEDGRVQAALSNFIHCRVLRERALYRSNRDLTATYDMLSKCYATLGQYSQSIQFLKLTLPAIEEQFGSNSIEVANELQKLSDVILCDLRTMETAPSKEVLDNTSSVVERALSILSVHSGSWDEGWQDLNKKLQELKLMKEMASLQGGFDKTSLGI